MNHLGLILIIASWRIKCIRRTLEDHYEIFSALSSSLDPSSARLSQLRLIRRRTSSNHFQFAGNPQGSSTQPTTKVKSGSISSQEWARMMAPSGPSRPTRSRRVPPGPARSRRSRQDPQVSFLKGSGRQSLTTEEPQESQIILLWWHVWLMVPGGWIWWRWLPEVTSATGPGWRWRRRQRRRRQQPAESSRAVVWIGNTFLLLDWHLCTIVRPDGSIQQIDSIPPRPCTQFHSRGCHLLLFPPPPLPPPAAPTRQAFHRHRTSCRVIATGTNRFPLSSSAPDRLVAYFEVGVTSTTPDCDGCPRPLLFM